MVSMGTKNFQKKKKDPFARTVIPFQLEEMRGFGDAPVDDAIGRRVQIFGEEVGQYGRDGRTDLRWFEHGRASSSYGADNGLETQKNGEIPGPVAS